MRNFKNILVSVALLVLASITCSSVILANGQDVKSISGADHRSEVSKVVQSLLEVANRTGGIGQEIRMIAQDQASTTEKVAEVIDKIKGRSSIKTFLIGSDYKNLGALRSEIAKTSNRISQLTREMERMATTTDKAVIESEIKSLEGTMNKLDSFVKTNESKFSVFGWFVKLFSK